MAELLSDWLEQVIQAVESWISTGIEKGARSNEELSNKLEESRVGIICLTRENPDENWILFEAGALSKTKDAHVCTFLLDLKPTDVERPLADFHYTKFEKEDVRKLLHTINGAVKKRGERALGEKQLDKIFERFWPDLEEPLKKIRDQGPPGEAPTRSPDDMLQEMLELVRAMERRQQEQESRWVASASIPSGNQPLHMLGTFIPPGEELSGRPVRNALVYYFDKSKQEEEEKRKDKEVDFGAALRDKEVDFGAALKSMERKKKKRSTQKKKP